MKDDASIGLHPGRSSSLAANGAARVPAFPDDLIADLDVGAAGDRAYALMEELFPLCRSITGEGVRQTLARVARDISLQLTEVPSGQAVFDWVIPEEWNIHAAWIRDANGAPVVDFADHNLHVVAYSEPVASRMRWSDLRPRIHTLPDQPDAIPYRTSYYERSWGFCMPDRLARQLDAHPAAEYEVLIDSTLAPGSLTFGECVLPGESEEEFLVSAHCCHPSLANDNLSGMAVAVELARWLASRSHRYTYRFVFAPGTIGALAWLHSRQSLWPRIRHGLVLSLLGDSHPPQYKRSRRDQAEIDEVASYVTRALFPQANIIPFSPLGYDERQFCSPGIDLPVGRACRSEYGSFSEYHTSDDNLDFVTPADIATSLGWVARMIDTVESNRTYHSQVRFGEPHLAKHARLAALAARSVSLDDAPPQQLDREAVAWLMNFSDGHHSLLAIAQRSGLSFSRLVQSAHQLVALQLLQQQEPTQ